MLPAFVAAALAVSSVCIKHTQLENSTNPTRTFLATIPDYDGLTLEPRVRYRTENNNLHVVNMAAVGECAPNCTYSARVTFEAPGWIRYTIDSGEGFGHSLWAPPEGAYGVFWVLPREGSWIDVAPVHNGTGQIVSINATIDAAASANVNFVFADTEEEVEFAGGPCIDNPCEKQVTVDVGGRSRVNYYIETPDNNHFWPEDRPYDTFYVEQPRTEQAAAQLSGGAWAGIGIGIACGTALVVYGMYRAIGKAGAGGEGESERAKLISGTRV